MVGLCHLIIFCFSVFAQLLCGRDDCQDLSFFTKTHQHFSFLFNTLFDVQLPSGREGFPLDCFKPDLGDVPLKSHEAHLVEVGCERWWGRWWLRSTNCIFNLGRTAQEPILPTVLPAPGVDRAGGNDVQGGYPRHVQEPGPTRVLDGVGGEGAELQAVQPGSQVGTINSTKW